MYITSDMNGSRDELNYFSKYIVNFIEFVCKTFQCTVYVLVFCKFYTFHSISLNADIYSEIHPESFSSSMFLFDTDLFCFFTVASCVLRKIIKMSKKSSYV